MFRVGVTIKQIENKAFAKLINFSSLNHLGGHKQNLGSLPLNAPRGYGPAATTLTKIAFPQISWNVKETLWRLQEQERAM